jgi:4-amino-4-deoxy-L-arabinose transferase-like glycosyltransferase
MSSPTEAAEPVARAGTGTGAGTDERERRYRLAFMAVVLGALVLRLVWILAFQRFDELHGDAIYYHFQANELAEGDGFIEPFKSAAVGFHVATAYHPPLYPLVLAVPSLLGGTSILAHQLVGAFIGAGTVLVLGLLGRHLFGWRTGLAVAIVAALHPNLWIADGLILPETPYALVVGGAILATYRLVDRPTPGRAAVLGLVLGVAALIRGEGAVFAAVLTVPLLLVSLRSVATMARLRLLAVTGVVALLVISPWVIRNLRAFEEPTLLSTNGGTTLAAANCPLTYHGEHLGYFSVNCWRIEETPPLEDSLQDQFWRRRAFDHISDNIGRVPVVVAARVGRVWEVYRPADNRRNDRFEERHKGAAWAGLFAFYALIPLAVLGLVRMRRAGRLLWPLVAPFVFVTLITIVFYGNTRFRIPAEVALVVLAGIGIGGLLDRWWPERAGSSPPSPGRA